MLPLTRPATALVLLLAPLFALAQDYTAPAPADAWSKRKCSLYQQAVADALATLGSTGLRPEFLSENNAFIASGCTAPTDICARTEQEFTLANLLTVMTMNEGMASTFVPFGCPASD